MNVLKVIKHSIRSIVDTVAPPDPLIRKVEEMDAQEFMDILTTEGASKEAGGILSFFSYKNPTARRALTEIKSRRNEKIVRKLGRVAYDVLLEELEKLALFQNSSFPVLVPLPMTRKKTRERGWNQCELVAKEMEKFDCGTSFVMRTDVLIKSRETDDQVGKDRAERLRNVKDSFGVKNAQAIRGRDVIVLDDIATTGATLSEAKRALVCAGAKTVLPVALAR